MPTYMVSGRFLAPFLRHFGAHLEPFWRASSNNKRKNNIREIMKNTVTEKHGTLRKKAAKMIPKSMLKRIKIICKGR